MVVNIVRCKGAMVFGCSNSQLAEKPPYRSRVKVPGAVPVAAEAYTYPRLPEFIRAVQVSVQGRGWRVAARSRTFGRNCHVGRIPNFAPSLLQGWCTASRAATMSSPRGSPSAKPGCPAPHAGPIQTPISASLSTQKTEYEKIASDSRAQTGEIQFTRITRRTTRGVPVEPGAPYHRSCRSLPPSRRQA